MDSNMYDRLFSLLKASLMGKPFDISLFDEMENSQWDNIYSMARDNGLLAVCYDGLLLLPKEIRPYRSLYIKWALSVENIEKRYFYQQKVLKMVEDIFTKEKMCFLLMKGFSVSKYYPKPEHRECGDIDIYMGDNYSKGNEIFRSSGFSVEEDYYRHSHINFQGVLIENHCMLSDTRGRKDNVVLEEKLISLAKEALHNSQDTVVYPPVDFSALFLNWHCEGHFMYEKIQLRHIYDWALFLKNEGKNMDMTLFRSMKYKCTFGKMSDMLTSIALEYLGLDADLLPEALVEDAKKVNSALRDKVLMYIFSSLRTDRSGGVWMQRWRVLKRTVQDSWKIREVLGMNPVAVIWRKGMGVIKGE